MSEPCFVEGSRDKANDFCFLSETNTVVVVIGRHSHEKKTQ